LDHGRFHEESRAIVRTNASAKYALHRPFFLYVARLEHPAKNHVGLIAAFDQFKKATGSDWQLVFGGSDWSGAETIHAAIRNAHFGDDIKTLGFVDDKDLPGLYRAADAFVYPSLYEGFGMPPIEAMACGCPVISSACGSLGEVVGTAAAIVDPKDVDSIAEKLAVLASDEGERGRLRAAGLARAKCFNWMSTAAQTLQVYEEVCEAASRRTVASPRRKGRKRIPAYKTPMPGPQRSR
jgi:glycosyltransferase involved in cell wall biosynthesis